MVLSKYRRCTGFDALHASVPNEDSSGTHTWCGMSLDLGGWNSSKDEPLTKPNAH